MPVSLTKSRVIIGLVLLAGQPWFTGGRSPVALLISSAALLIAGFLVWRSRELEQLPLPLAGAGGWVLLWGLLSFFWSINRYQTLLFNLQLGLAAVAFMIIWQLRRDAGLRQSWKQAYVITAAGFSLYGGWLYIVGGYERLTSSFYWANPFAAWLLPALLIGWQLQRRSRGNLWLALTAVNLAAFLLADSRSATLVIAIAGVALVVWRRPRRAEWIKLLLMLALTAGLVTGLNTWRSQYQGRQANVPGARFSEAIEGESQSGSDRLNYLRASWEIFKDSPVWGSGAGTFAAAHPAYQIRVTSAASHPHSIWPQVAVELGVVGLVLWLGLIGLWLKFSSRQDLAVWLATVVLLVHFGLDIDARYPAMWLLLAVLAGWSLDARQKPRRSKLAPVWLAVLLPLLVSAQLYQSEQQAVAGQNHQDHSRYEAAIASFTAARSGLVYDPDLLTKEAINHYALGLETRQEAELAAAEQLATLATRQDPRDSQHYFLLARISQARGELDQALQMYQRALQLDTLNHPEYYLDLAQLHLRREQPNEAVEVLNRVITLYPDPVITNRSANPRLKMIMAQIYSLRGVLTGSMADAERALRLDRHNRQAQQLKSQLTP